jgi:hypothetical protein
MNYQPSAGRGADRRERNMTTTTGSVIAAMYAGLATTVVATIVAYVDRATSHTLTDHIRAGYPTYTQARIDTAASTYVVYLSVVGVLGVAVWLWAIRAVTTGKRWARGAATTLFALGTGIALIDLLVKDTSGDTGLSPLLGWVGVLPCLPGLVAVTLLWSRSGILSSRDSSPQPAQAAKHT